MSSSSTDSLTAEALHSKGDGAPSCRLQRLTRRRAGSEWCTGRRPRRAVGHGPRSSAASFPPSPATFPEPSLHRAPKAAGADGRQAGVEPGGSAARGPALLHALCVSRTCSVPSPLGDKPGSSRGVTDDAEGGREPLPAPSPTLKMYQPHV